MAKSKLTKKQKLDPKVIALLLLVALGAAIYVFRSYAATDSSKASVKKTINLSEKATRIEQGGKQK